MNAPAPKLAPKPSRMTLAAVTRGVQTQPLRVIVYGPGGIGKSTFGAQAPAPIFLGPEDGSALLDVARFPQPETWADTFDALRALTSEAHDFGTLVIDSADWLEPLCWEHVCRASSKRSIEDFGYGKGYVAALEEWRRLLAAIESLRKAKRMHVIVIAHGEVKAYKNPEAEGDYDRWQLKLHRAAAGLLTEWCDELVFANFRTYTQKVDPNGPDKKRARGYGSERVLYTERRAAFDAKSRHGLPPEMPLSWAEFFAATQRGAGEVVANLRTEIEGALEQLQALDAARAEKARAIYTNTAPTPDVLGVFLNQLRTRIAEHTAKAATETTEGAPSAA